MALYCGNFNLWLLFIKNKKDFWFLLILFSFHFTWTKETVLLKQSLMISAHYKLSSNA